eukprot:SAG31_NODE_63_length_28659_cov_23.074685_19_plen_839_part_00
MPLDILQLQDKARRDPTAYRDEFLLQHRRFLASLEVIRLKPSAVPDEFIQLVHFLAHLATTYKATLAQLPQQLIQLVDGDHCSLLDPDVRKTVVASLILLRNRSLVEASVTLPVFFRLFRVHDKELRKLLYQHIISDVRNANKKGDSQKLNRALQNFMYKMVSSQDQLAAQKSLEVMIDLYRRKLWADARTANVISTAVFSSTTKLRVTALNFFIHVDDQIAAMAAQAEDSDDDDGDGMGGQKPKDILAISKQELLEIQKKEGKGVKKVSNKTKKRVELLKRRMKKQNQGEEDSPASSALYHIYDPQSFAERLFTEVKKSHEKFDIKLMMINLVARLISTHNLLLLNFYPFLQRYLQPHQKQVSAILSYLAEATHELVPQEDLEPLVRTICYNFITERNSGDAIAAGLNTVRIIASRVPAVLHEDMVHDLVQYKTHRDKGVCIAARALIEVYRLFDPMKLQKKERGKDTDLSVKPKLYGAGAKVHTDLPGIELLGQDTDDEVDSEDGDAGLDSKNLSDDNDEDDDSDSDSEIDADSDIDSSGGDANSAQDDSDAGHTDTSATGDQGWTSIEHQNFMVALNKYGESEDVDKAWLAIYAAIGGSKTVNQIKAHAEWHFANLQAPAPRSKKRKRQEHKEDLDRIIEEENAAEDKLRTTEDEDGSDANDAHEKDKISSTEAKEERTAQRPDSVQWGGERILSQEEHEVIKRRRVQTAVAHGLGYKGERGVVRVSHEEIEGYKKKVKLDREQKIAMAQAGREDRGKYGVRKEKGGNQLATNKDKQKTKLYLMLQKKQKRVVNKLTLNQKKKGTGFMAKLKHKGRKTQLGKKAVQVLKKRKKTR